MCSVFFKSVQACKLGSIMYRTKKKSSSLFSPSLHTISCIPSRSCFNSSVSPPESSYAVVLDFKQFWNISLGWECSQVEPNLFCLSRWALYMALSIGDHTAQCLEVRGKVRSLFVSVCVSVCVRVVKEMSVVMHFISAAFLPDVNFELWQFCQNNWKENAVLMMIGLVQNRVVVFHDCLGIVHLGEQTHTYHLPTYSFTFYFTFMVCGCVLSHVCWEPKSIHSVLVELPNT